MTHITQSIKSTVQMVVICSAFVFLLSACWPPAHKIDINQGNLLDQAAVQQLQIGMTTAQVQFLVGAPILSKPFNKQQWDYIYLAQPGGKAPERKLLRLHFQDDLLIKIEGDMLDSSEE